MSERASSGGADIIEMEGFLLGDTLGNSRFVLHICNTFEVVEVNTPLLYFDSLLLILRDWPVRSITVVEWQACLEI